MSLSEAAAALDRLLWGHSQEALPRGAGPNVPPYAPPPVAQENLLPALLPRTHTLQAQGPLSSTPVASPDDAPRTSALLPWEALTHPAAEDLPFPVSPLQASPIPPPPPSDSWLALSDPPQHSRSCRRSPEDQCPSRRSNSNSSSSSSSSSSGDQGPGGEDDDDDDGGSPTTPTGSFTPLDPEKYKTELCRSYQVHGFCRYGARCNYAHGLRQLRGASHHGKYKTRNCQSYHQTGFCRYGARCSFIHDPEEGVLKCSIANKEVLEALYYFPTYEEASRTASITWRLQEAGSPHTQELHLIANNRPLEDEPGHVASPRASPRGFLDAGDFFLGGSRLWAYNPSSPLGDDRSCLVTHDGKDSVTPLGSHGRGVASGTSPQLTTHPAGSSVGQRRPGWDASLEGKERFVAQMDPLSRQLQQNVSGGVAAAARASLFPMKSRRRLSWWDVAPADFDPLGGKGVVGSLASEYQDLQRLDVVHSILQKAPQYSATLWSDGTDGGPAPDPAPDPVPSAAPNNFGSYCRKEDKNREAGDDDDNDDKDKDVPKDNSNKSRNKDDDDYGDDPSSRSRRTAMPTDEDDVVLSSSLQSDTEDDGKAVQGAEGAAGGDDWSVSRSLHLADLIRCLRVREHQLPPEENPLTSLTSLPLPVRRRSHDLTKYKTELCRSFQYNGYCEYGEACLYAHGSLDLRCYPRHPMYRTKQCFSFHNKGFCLYGSRCQFLHDLE